MRSKVPNLFWAACAIASANAQPLLTSAEALRIAMRNNFSISLARDQTAGATVNRQSALGPFLPGISASANTSGNLTDSITRRTTVGVSANWQIFSGFQSYNAYQRAKSTERSAELQERSAIETTVESVLNGYYNVVLQKQLLAATRELLGVAQDQVRLAKINSEIGAGSKLDEWTSVASLNEDSSSFLAQETSLRQSKVLLNQLLARDPSLEFEVIDSIPLETGFSPEGLRASLPENNATLLQARAQKEAAASGLQQAKGQRWPSLDAGVDYSATPSGLNSSNTPGINDGNGTYSVKLSVPIFDQLQTRQAVSVARLQLRSGETQVRQVEENVLGEFEVNRRKYLSGLQQVALEERNLEVSKLQAGAANEQFKIGKITALDLRAANQLLLGAQSRLVTARQNTRQSELALKRLAGKLVTE